MRTPTPRLLRICIVGKFKFEEREAGQMSEALGIDDDEVGSRDEFCSWSRGLKAYAAATDN
jgi:hypothetical protein